MEIVTVSDRTDSANELIVTKIGPARYELVIHNESTRTSSSIWTDRKGLKDLYQALEHELECPQ